MCAVIPDAQINSVGARMVLTKRGHRMREQSTPIRSRKGSSRRARRACVLAPVAASSPVSSRDIAFFLGLGTKCEERQCLELATSALCR